MEEANWHSARRRAARTPALRSACTAPRCLNVGQARGAALAPKRARGAPESRPLRVTPEAAPRWRTLPPGFLHRRPSWRNWTEEAARNRARRARSPPHTDRPARQTGHVHGYFYQEGAKPTYRKLLCAPETPCGCRARNVSPLPRALACTAARLSGGRLAHVREQPAVAIARLRGESEILTSNPRDVAAGGGRLRRPPGAPLAATVPARR
jgi:hypothetical protein